MLTARRVHAEGVIRQVATHTPSARLQQSRMRELYSQFVRKDDLCFDVGANYGTRASVLASLGARVVAVEPQLECLGSLRRLHGHGVEAIPLALGSSVRIDNLQIGSISTISSMSREFVDQARRSRRFGKYSWLVQAQSIQQSAHLRVTEAPPASVDSGPCLDLPPEACYALP